MRKRNVAILFRLNKKEAEALDKKVKKSGLNREAYLRQLISGVVPKDAPPPDYYSMMRELHKIGNNLNQMAVTSIWSIKGWIGKVIKYAENPDKTKENNEGQISESQSQSTQGLEDVITYAVNTEKTRWGQSESMERELVGESEELMEQYVSGVNCAPTTAREEMIAVKKRFGKEDGIVAFHGYQSFAPGECNPAMAHEIGKKLAEELWGGQYQVLIATHLDKANHLHNHFVVNSVSFLDGKRYHRTNQDYRDMRMVSDRLCKEYQLSVVQQPEQGKGKHYVEWQAEQEGKPSYHSMVKADVDEAIRKARTEKQFFFYFIGLGCQKVYNL